MTRDPGFQSIVSPYAETYREPEHLTRLDAWWGRMLRTPLRQRLWYWGGPVVVTLIAAVLRLWHLGNPRSLVFDETFYVKDAWTLMHLGYEANWEGNADQLFTRGDVNSYLTGGSFIAHPPLGKWVISLGLRVFGAQDAIGWRISTVMVGILAVFVLVLVAAPILGRLSDRFGRRPVLAASQFGTALSFLILGLSSHYTVMLLARLLDGASGGNILVAQAYVADVTRPEERSRGYGLIGMAFGLGFVLGPLLSLALVELPVAPEWRLRLPFLVAAGFSTLAWVLVVWRLPESLPRDARSRQSARVLSRRGLAGAVATPGVARMITLGTLTILAFAALEATLSLYLGERQGWGPRGVLGGFTYLGLITALVQGGLVRRLVPRLGEPRLILCGLVLLAVGFTGLALASGAGLIFMGLTLVAVGQGLAVPPISGLLSRITPAAEQGAIFGTFSAAQTLARMANYVLASYLFGRGTTAAPFWEAAAIALGALGLAAVALPGVQKLAQTTPEAVPRSTPVPVAAAESLAPGTAGA